MLNTAALEHNQLRDRQKSNIAELTRQLGDERRRALDQADTEIAKLAQRQAEVSAQQQQVRTRRV